MSKYCPQSETSFRVADFHIVSLAAANTDLDIEVEYGDESKDCDALVVIRPCYRARDVGGHNGYEGCGCESCALAPDFFDKKVGGERAKGRKQGRCEHTHLHRIEPNL